ncbi:MAG: FHA domain-containing protein [Candidatus Binatia bacterium]
MAPLGYLEVLDARGHVAQRLRLDHLPIQIGRAYTSDLVIDDVYVCPLHVSVFADDHGRLVCRDRDSLNGLYAGARGSRVASLELESGGEFRIGHTVLRYCAADHPVAPTLVDRQDRMSLWYSPRTAVIAGVAVLTLLCLDSFLGSVERVTAAGVVSEPLMTLSTLLLWAGLWALAGRVVVSRFQFPQHVTIACCAIVAFMTLGSVSEWTEFLFPIFPAMWLASLFGSGLILAGLVYFHLRFAAPMQRRSRLWTAVAVSAASMGLSLILHIAARAKFSTTMDYTGIVKPLAAALVPAISVDQFIGNSQKLRDELTKLVQKAKPNQP